MIKENSNAYRQDIDGLRGIAVLFVFLNHLGLKWLPGGYFGVDIFFVISGFLITSHILSELNQGNFSLTNFYLKRMRRILPAMLFMVFLVSLASYFLLLNIDFHLYVSSLMATIFYVPNLFLWYKKLEYFSPNTNILPLMHTWSLGIEEQFYIFWPVFLIFYARIFSDKLTSLMCLAGVFLSCAYYCLTQNADSAFYLPFTRAFELLIGAALAAHYSDLKLPSNKLITNLMSILGLYLIFYSGLSLGEDVPRIVILLPCLGAVLLILSGKDQKPFGNKILSVYPLTFCGLISYSLYLWHWPFIAYLNYFSVKITFFIASVVFMMAVSISCLSWFFIEKPFRFKYKFDFKKTFFIFFVSPATITLCVFFFSNFKYVDFNAENSTGLDQLSPAYLSDIFTMYDKLKKSFGCHDKELSDDLPPKNLCSIGDTAQIETTALLIGDSHAFSYVGMINVLLSNAGLKGYVVTEGRSKSRVYVQPNKDVSDLKNIRNNKISEEIKSQKYKYVIISEWWKMVDEPGLMLSLENITDFIIKNNATPVFILDFPPLLDIQPTCGFMKINLSKCYNTIDAIKAYQKSNQLFYRLKNKYPKIILIDPNPLLCDKSKCYSSIDGIPLYFDSLENSHLNYTGSSYLGSLYIRKYGNPFLPKK